MCYIELEPCETWNVRTQRARKEHRCSCCSAPIRPGDQYVSIFSVLEGEPSYERSCLLCDAAAGEFADDHDGMRGNPSYFPEMLRDCIDGGDEESETRWRPMLTAIEGRSAVARRATP